MLINDRNTIRFICKTHENSKTYVKGCQDCEKESNSVPKTDNIPISKEAKKAYDDFVNNVKEVKKEKWKKCQDQCDFETQIDGSHKCCRCHRVINANASPRYDIPIEDNDIIDESSIDVETDSDVEFEKDDVIDEADF